MSWLNTHQIEQSARFLYSASDDFNFARAILKERPDLRLVSSHATLGEMGQAPPTRAGMPSGTQLVILGSHDHCMLAVEEIDDAGEGLTLRTKEIGLLTQVADDQSMLQVDLYVDGQQIRHLCEAMVERFGPASKGWFQVVHRDPALRSFAAHFDPGKL